MLLLKLYKDSDGKVVYNYFPEGNDAYGTVSMDKVSGEIKIDKLANVDVHSIYMHRAVSRLSKYHKEKVYPKEDTVAWF